MTKLFIGNVLITLKTFKKKLKRLSGDKQNKCLLASALRWYRDSFVFEALGRLSIAPRNLFHRLLLRRKSSSKIKRRTRDDKIYIR